MRIILSLWMALSFTPVAHALDLTPAELDQYLETVHPVRADFDSAESVRRCLNRQLFPVLERATQGLGGVVLDPPRISIDYVEHFREYGGHLSFSYKFKGRTAQGRTYEIVLPVSTTAQPRTTYEFVRKGLALRKSWRTAWVTMRVPTVDGKPIALPKPAFGWPEGRFMSDYGCHEDAPVISEETSEYPRCTDPNEDCPDPC